MPHRKLVIIKVFIALIVELQYFASAMATRSFYRRALPPTCTALSSVEGRQLFESALRHKGLKSFFKLMEQLYVT